jgi:uncharacterized protein YceH (UPF0502 family)
MSHPLPLLTPAEARVLGVLVEKSRTTPDVYPLTLNSLTAGCNQKTSRDPVMSLAESEVQATLDELRHRALVMESYGASGRVLRYAQNFAKVYDLPSAAVALLAVLMLRGPQTVSELRANCERLHHFADGSAVEGYLDELASRESGALAIRLPRQPGAREQRWAHLLCGEVALDSPAVAAVAGDRLAELEARLSRVEAELAELRARIE